MQSFRTPKNVQQPSQGESSSPWPDSPKGSAQGGICPREGARMALISQDERSKAGPLQLPSPSSLQRIAELLHLRLQLEGQRCTPAFWNHTQKGSGASISPQQQTNLRLIVQTKLPVGVYTGLRVRCKVRLTTSWFLLFTPATGISQVKRGFFVLSPHYSKRLANTGWMKIPSFLSSCLLAGIGWRRKPPQPFPGNT